MIRALAFRTALFATLLIAGLCGLSPRAAAQPAKELPEYLQALGYLEWDEGAEVDKRGVVHFDRERAAAGYNLYTDDRDRIFLMDLAGKLVHSWRVPTDVFKKPAKTCEFAKLLRSGQLAVVCVQQGIVFLDWNSKPSYVAKGFYHHDVAELADGRLLAPARTEELEYVGRKVAFDGLMLFSLAGGGGEVWSSKARIAEVMQHHPPLDLETPPAPGTSNDTLHDYYHLNSIQLLPDTPLGRKDKRFQQDNWLISLRNANLVLILDRDTQHVVWSYGPGVLELQHTPTMLENGNILIFDNGSHRGHSRVIELEPVGGTIAWEYHGRPPESFFSKWRGNAQRLSNGNTLITESERGHVFEVTREGEVVWDFWNSEIEEGKRKRIYRMTRLSPGRVQALLNSPAAKPAKP